MWLLEFIYVDVMADRVPRWELLAEKSRALFLLVSVAPTLSCDHFVFHQCEKAANCHLISLKNQDNGMSGKPEEAIRLSANL